MARQGVRHAGLNAAAKFDIAGSHRGGVGSLAGTLKLWRDFFNSHGRADAPLWVTEHGYPADPAYQYDPAYRGGETAQAAFMRDSLPTLLRAGAQKVFVTTRDTWPGEFGAQSPFNSEGVATLSPDAPYPVRRKPGDGRGPVARGTVAPDTPHGRRAGPRDRGAQRHRHRRRGPHREEGRAGPARARPQARDHAAPPPAGSCRGNPPPGSGESSAQPAQGIASKARKAEEDADLRQPRRSRAASFR